jgi:fucose 4-O-acetylase-like acetyltransferase
MAERANNYIDTARGVTCVLLVAYHVIGLPTSGLRVQDDSYWRFFADLLIYFRMPMFAFLSGYTYACRPYAGETGRFIYGKAKKLLLPMFIVGTLFAVVQSLVPGTNGSGAVQNWTTLHIVPVAHFWFVESLFLIFLLIVILESLRLLGDQLRLIIVLAAAIAVDLTVEAPIYFGLQGAVYLLPYFICGLAYSRFREEYDRWLPAAILVFVVSYGYAAAGMLGYAPHVERASIAALLIGIAGPFVLLHPRWKNRGFAFIGMSSYTIYLFHPFFTASVRMTLNRLHISDINFLMPVLTFVGVLGPILIHKFAERFWNLRMVEGGNPNRIVERLGAYRGFVIEWLASHGKRSHTILAHVSQRHRRAAVLVAEHS